MISGCRRASMPRQSSYNSLHKNPLRELRHNRSNSEGVPRCASKQNSSEDGEQPRPTDDDKENVALIANATPFLLRCDKAFKPSSLQFCMQMNEPEKEFVGSAISENSSSLKIWDYSDSEAAPASSWSTLPNKSLLLRPLPLDIGKCTCVIVKEASPEGTLYSLYTNEGRGREDRKLAVAKYRRRRGRSEFTVAQTTQGTSSTSDDGILGTIKSNLMGSKYHVLDQGTKSSSSSEQPKSLAAVVAFSPTITTWTGNYRSMRAYIAKHQSMQLKSTSQVQQHIKGLPKDWDGRKANVHQLCSRIPQYNKIIGQYELDFRNKGRAGLRIQSSVKNFQLTLEESGRQTILQLGRVGKSKYVMDYRYPLTGYQAFCICLASIDSKLCCSV